MVSNAAFCLIKYHRLQAEMVLFNLQEAVSCYVFHLKQKTQKHNTLVPH